MKNFFSIDTPIWQTLTKISMTIWMNFLWLVCCIPVVTIGAATAAYYRMLFNICEEKDVSFRLFFRAFAANFKQATVLWLLQLAAAAGLGLLAWYVLAVTSNLVRTVLLVFFLGGLFAFSLVYLYGPALIAYFYNSLGGTVKNALAMGIRHYHQTIPALVLTMLPFAFLTLLPYWFLRWFPLVITFGISAVNYCIILLMEKVFQHYTD